MLIYALTIFISAFLLFEVEPMMAKFILPWFGGAQSVWTTCILFFQMLLLAGYAYAHAVGSYLRPHKGAIAHLGLVFGCVTLMAILARAWQSPIMPGAQWKPPDADFPTLRILILLSASVGLPFFVLSATGPLLQVWFAQVYRARSPYPLYALSNLGSMLALITYPVVLEPALRLRSQAQLWFLLYIAFAVGIGLCAWPLRKLQVSASASEPVEGNRAARPAAAIRMLWVALAACASLMMLAVTNQICQDVAAIPFLWVVPLAIYLLSFIICFGDERWYRRGIFQPALAVAIVLSGVFLLTPHPGLISQIVLYSFLLFCGCMVCHGELVRLKPPQRYLTVFYLMVSVGGAAGGLFAAVIAPWIFRGYWEFQLSIWACALLLFLALEHDEHSWIQQRRPALAIVLFAVAMLTPELVLWVDGTAAGSHSYPLGVAATLGVIGVVAFREQRSPAGDNSGRLVKVSVIAGLVILAAVLLAGVKGRLNNCLVATRNFYGAIAVVSRDANDSAWHSYSLRHGRVTHGVQFPQPDKRHIPTTYYGYKSGIGLLLLHYPRRNTAHNHDGSLRIGVVGLGAGTLAAYGRPRDYIRFYEINPAIIKLATDPNGYFTYLRDTRARVDIIPGDARLSMEKEVDSGKAQRFDILAVDAFSGDAIPVHLLTRQAIELYLRQLRPNGVVAVHVSNGYLDLIPVLRESARYFALRSALIHSESDGRMTETSDWILLSRNTTVLSRLQTAVNLRPLESVRKVRLWTDDYSNLFQLLK